MQNSMIKKIGFGILSCLILPTPAGLAQNQFPEPFAYPTRNQTPEQQQKDQAACSQWATQQTGVNPSRLSSATTAQSSQQGAVARGAARGALFGTVGGAIGGNAGQGAAIGAGVGALGGLFVRRDAELAAAQTQARVNAAEQQQLQTYFRAWTACMEGRGYTVN
ncbi:MAG TPA: glycine zipper family protein [Coleofasciculaceae cyanobacterium]